MDKHKVMIDSFFQVKRKYKYSTLLIKSYYSTLVIYKQYIKVHFTLAYNISYYIN